jgi:oligopeptide/dipeptide ABC transporter ATP-binding protein
MTTTANEQLIRIDSVSRSFGEVVALDSVSIDIRENEFFALLGPSGCGKTTLLRVLAGFEEPDSGTVTLAGSDLLALAPNRRPINLMFQSYALFPHMSVEKNIAYGLEREHLPKAEVRSRVDEVLETVVLVDKAKSRPAQLSGGQRQRICIARALSVNPRVLIADESVSALDVSIRAQIIDLLIQLQAEMGLAMIFISHDLAAVSGVADEVAVMYAGRIVEQAPVDEFFASRRMPYGEALLRARPMADTAGGQRLEAIGGRPPDLAALPPGCAFAERCKHVQPDCLLTVPPMVIEGGRRYACLHPLSEAPARGVSTEQAT